MLFSICVAERGFALPCAAAAALSNDNRTSTDKTFFMPFLLILDLLNPSCSCTCGILDGHRSSRQCTASQLQVTWKSFMMSFSFNSLRQPSPASLLFKTHPA